MNIRMNISMIAVAALTLVLTMGPVVSAQTSGDGMMQGGPGEMKGMGPGQMQMMNEMNEMMGMMQMMMRHMNAMTKDNKAKQEMGEMMKQMDQMRMRHQDMMKQQGMMPPEAPK
jgi:hypothetical protein